MSGLFKKLAILFIAVIATSNLRAQLNVNRNPKNDTTKYVYLTYGLLAPRALGAANMSDASKIVEHKWKFEFKIIGGCLVDKHFEDSIAMENQPTINYLKSAFGEDWKKRLNNECDIEYNKLKEMVSWIKADPDFRIRLRNLRTAYNLDGSLKEINNHLNYNFDTTDEKKVYKASLTGTSKYNIKVIEFIINYDNHQIQIL